MATINLAQLGTATMTATADTNGSVNSVALRDSAGGLTSVNHIATSNTATATIQKGIAANTSSFTVDATADIYFCDTTAGAITVTLPTASVWPGREIKIIKVDSASNAVTATGVLGTGATSTSQYSSFSATSNGTSWYGHS